MEHYPFNLDQYQQITKLHPDICGENTLIPTIENQPEQLSQTVCSFMQKALSPLQKTKRYYGRED